ncbi:hypothetical protein C8J55DRAFT_525501 [Lentinula edodes]|uniref:Uncharacterized protein n=1 Tax=Lentinula lateritia TaxID=40482 RepID=A0A9W9DFE2_9AGAR|nr:hypothetical protein C8J55DRAFT_525501 [Lentinula edodes]
MIFPNKFPFILLVMTTSLCCMRLLVSVHASPLGATLKDRAQLNGGRISLGYYYTALSTTIRHHNGFNALMHDYLTIFIQPSCFFQGNAYSNERSSLFLYQLYSSTSFVLDQDKKLFIRSKELDPDKTIIVSPSLHIEKDPKFLDDLVFVFPDSLLLPYLEIYHKKYLNPLQIDAQLVNSGKFVDWRDWPKKIIDLPPDLKPRRPRP